ncbi:MAG: methylmalonyl-CoA mutase family protein [Bacteroidota bacterium]
MNALFEEFSASNAQAWKERLAKDLKGITFEDLSVQDRNGNTIRPFYTSEEISKANRAVFNHKDWTICAQIKVTNEKEANANALSELESGVSGLYFIINTRVDISVLLKDIQLPYIQTRFVLSENALAFFGDWNEYVITNKLSDIDALLIYDPIASSLKTNQWNLNKDKAQWLKSSGTTLSVDATLFQNAGACSAYQIACTLAQTNEYLNWLSEEGKIKELKRINVSISTGTDFFEEIAKLRALRLTIHNLTAAYSISVSVELHAETSDAYRSAFDAYSNLLRDTLSGMAAVLGGCDSLLIHPFDQNKNEESNLSKRMSRNQQLIMKEESYFNQIADASAGSFYIENLTEQLAVQGWELFKVIEQDGGIIESSYKIRQEIELQAKQWVEEYKSGKRVLIGVNKFVDAKDQPKPFSSEHFAGIQPISLSEQLI